MNQPVHDPNRDKNRTIFTNTGRIRVARDEAVLEVDCSDFCTDEARQHGTVEIKNLSAREADISWLGYQLERDLHSKRRGVSVERYPDNPERFHLHFQHGKPFDRKRQLRFLFNRLNPREFDPKGKTPLRTFLTHRATRGHANFPLKGGLSISIDCGDYASGTNGSGLIITYDSEKRLVDMEFLMKFLSAFMDEKLVRFERDPREQTLAMHAFRVIFASKEKLPMDEVRQLLTTLYETVDQFAFSFDPEKHALGNDDLPPGGDDWWQTGDKPPEWER